MPPPTLFTDDQLLRYSRHILLPQFGIEGQTRLAHARVLIVGAGGLGCPVALYLGAAGVGTLEIADGDHVDLTNLQRQIGHPHARLGTAKAESLAASVQALNPEIRVHPVAQALTGEALQAAVARVDLVVDASDNFATRHAVNRACVALHVPLVSGAAIGFAGQLAVFDARDATSPCYHCLFPENSGPENSGPENTDPDEPALRCSEAGVLGPLVGIIGALQAHEAIKCLSGVGQPLRGRLLLWDGLTAETRTLRVPRDPGCAVCAPPA